MLKNLDDKSIEIYANRTTRSLRISDDTIKNKMRDAIANTVKFYRDKVKEDEENVKNGKIVIEVETKEAVDIANVLSQVLLDKMEECLIWWLDLTMSKYESIARDELKRVTTYLFKLYTEGHPMTAANIEYIMNKSLFRTVDRKVI